MGWFSKKEAEPSQYQKALSREYEQKYDDLFDVDTANVDEWNKCAVRLKETRQKLHEEEDRTRNHRRR